MTQVISLRAGDNFMYLHPCGDGRAFVVDPGDAPTVLRALRQHDLSLAAILVTHHHWDHMAGAADLRAQTPCEMIGVDRSLILGSDRTVADGDVLTLGTTTVRVLATPGHTRSSVCYYVPPQNGARGLVYTGDTLFVGGCGRVLEGEAAALWKSLQRLAGLPPDTSVYCGHDYTLENYEFAVHVDPANRRFRERLAEVQKAVEYRRLTVPSTIAQESATNIFLQSDTPQVQAALSMAGADPLEVFAELRRRKDFFA
ncbi:MAG: hydroxyacylglutathione hydrolase [Planctomycetes bacterium]|nr:hydroxyacylglutathione hydrolase [Planctomycetota bacterium]